MGGCMPLVDHGTDHCSHLNSIAEQIKRLQTSHVVGIVIGGGNIFRASREGKALGLRQQSADQAGMLATVINGIVLRDKLESAGVAVTLLSAFAVPSVAQPVQDSTIRTALDKDHCIIFVGGTGNPFFTTDTCAVLRALQINATAVWKATKVDYIYDADPEQTASCSPLKDISYQTVIDKKLGIMDSTAITLAQQHRMPIRVFNAFTPNALVNAAHDTSIGSTIHI
jgi:uridylate kinase